MTQILIVGSGALALYFGARLTSAGAKVTLLGTWPEGIIALQEDGIRLSGADGDQNYPVTATSDIHSLKKFSYSLVLVKSWQTNRAAQQLAEVLHPDGLALTLQNGLGNLDILSSLLGEERTAQGVTTLGATLIGPGKVRFGGEGSIYLESDPKLSIFNSILKEAGFKIEEVDDLSGIVWSKLVINAAINPLTALFGVQNGYLLKSPAAKALSSAAANEAAQIAAAKGIDLVYEDPGLAVADVARSTSENRSSMLQDVDRGAPTEIDQINGAIVREGKKLGIQTPVNEIFWKLILSKVELNGQEI